ncbi:PREDICTED: uncharacterized protein LOC107065167 [Polistes dominula]|uniref:Mitochondrial genome maintenance exonuclease 1 n=1 Tax=Polistes dominula TaxID=743375 RepID=A0ABM1I1K9_POLDO|nr:PREDICTED: uncharacterized protein LOC107065167 [Polistes dominula]
MESFKMLFGHKCSIFLRNIKTTNICNIIRTITKIQQKNKEDKYMFGPMNKKKKKKASTTDSTVDLKDENITKDSELWWNLKISKSSMNLIQFKENIDCNTLSIMKLNTSNEKNLLLNCNENKVASKSKENNIKSKRIKDIKIRKSKTAKKSSKSKKADSKTNKDDSKNINDDSVAISKTDKDDRVATSKTNKDDRITTSKTNKDDSVVTKAISTELKFPQSKNEILNVDLIKLCRFPIFPEQPTNPEMLKQSEVLSFSLKDDPEILDYPSVTKILSESMSSEAQRALKLWKEKLIKEMGEEKFNEYQQELLNNGKLFHSCIEDTLYGREVDVPEHILPAYDSLSSIVNEIKDIRAIESFVSHKGLFYKGKVDCIATYKGKLCVIDWKKSDKEKGNLFLTYDAPIQLAAYVGAINSSKSYPFSIHYGMIVVGYTTGKPADIFYLSDHFLELHWSRWLVRMKKYWHNIQNQNNNSD